MVRSAYFINEDPEYMHALVLVRRHRTPSETEEETARRVLDDRLLSVWIKDMAVRKAVEP